MIQEDYQENRVNLAPPLMYETARLVNFTTVTDLLEYLKKHCTQPINRCMPVVVKCSDGVVYALPGWNRIHFYVIELLGIVDFYFFICSLSISTFSPPHLFSSPWPTQGLACPPIKIHICT